MWLKFCRAKQNIYVCVCVREREREREREMHNGERDCRGFEREAAAKRGGVRVHTLFPPCNVNLDLERNLFFTFISLITDGLIKEHMKSYVSWTLRFGDMNPWPAK